MYQNNSAQALKELAADQYKCHRTRNLTAIMAIFLTTLLLTAMLTAGFGFISTGANAGEQTPGPMSDGSIIGGPQELQKLRQMPEIEWANLVLKGSSLPLHNSVFGGIETRLYAPDDNFYNDNLVDVKVGGYPKGKDEIMISDTLARHLDLPEEAGQPFTLEAVIRENGKDTEKTLPLTICGIYKNPLTSISSIYEEIYTSKAFVEAYNPEQPEDKHIIYVKLANLNPLMLKTDVYGKLADVARAVGATEFSPGKNSADFIVAFTAALPFLLLVFLLMASGYFLIYNVFYISIVSDIRWFGMMKTIGATKRQVKAVMNRQVWKNAAWGILAGVAAGYLTGLVIAPQVMKMTDWSSYYKKPPFLTTALFALLFSCLTVKWSASKPIRTASGISPIEAARYTPKKKKAVFTIVSLTLGGVIFLTAANAVLGFQVERFAGRYDQEDYQIFHKSALWSLDEPYQPISEDLAGDIAALPFVDKVDTIYMARSSNLKVNNGAYYENSAGEIAPQGKLWDCVKPLLEGVNMKQYRGNGILWQNDRGNLKTSIFGLPADRWETEKVNYNILEGEFDAEKFASGDYVLYNNFSLAYTSRFLSEEARRDPAQSEIHAGDVLDLSFYDDAADTYRQKKLTVMAVIESAHEYSSSDIQSAMLTLPDTLFQEIYSDYAGLTASLQVRAKQELTGDQIGQLTKLVQREHSTQLQTSSRYESVQEAGRRKQIYALIGIFLAGVLAVIGISNIVNTVTADVYAHRLEYAAMQSVGMTKKQLSQMLFWQSMKLCGISFALTIPLGAAVGIFVTGSNLFTGFHVPLFCGMLAILFAVMLALCVILSVLLSRNLNQKSAVERLREAE